MLSIGFILVKSGFSYLKPGKYRKHFYYNTSEQGEKELILNVGHLTTIHAYVSSHKSEDSKLRKLFDLGCATA